MYAATDLAYVDVEDRRFEALVPWRQWRPTDPTPALFGFFIVSNPPEEWTAKGPDVRREVGLFSRADLTTQIAVSGGFESWLSMWEQSLDTGETLAVGTCRMPGAGWFDVGIASADLMSKGHFVERTGP